MYTCEFEDNLKFFKELFTRKVVPILEEPLSSFDLTDYFSDCPNYFSDNSPSYMEWDETTFSSWARNRGSLVARILYRMDILAKYKEYYTIEEIISRLVESKPKTWLSVHGFFIRFLEELKSRIYKLEYKRSVYKKYDLH